MIGLSAISKRRAQKKTLLSFQSLLRAGLWRLDGRTAYHADSEESEIHRILSPSAENASSYFDSARSYLKAILLSVSGLREFHVDHEKGDSDGSIVYASRDGKTKVFDFARGVILTTTSREEWADFQKAHALKLFQHVPTASSDLWESKEGLFRRDDMLPARPIVLLPTRTQELAYREFIRCYGDYIAAHRKPPRPDIILESYGEFLGVLSDDLRSHLRQWEHKIEDFSSRCAMVEGHLDVNVANLLYDGKIYVVDIADAGLAVPCLYDINNLALNEIYEGRDLSLLRALVSKPYADMLTSTVSGAIADFRSEDIRTSILVNVVMRESSYVSKALFKRPIRTRVANVRYGQFLRAMTEVDGSPAFGPHHDLETSPCIHAPNAGHDR